MVGMQEDRSRQVVLVAGPRGLGDHGVDDLVDLCEGHAGGDS